MLISEATIVVAEINAVASCPRVARAVRKRRLPQAAVASVMVSGNCNLNCANTANWRNPLMMSGG